MHYVLVLMGIVIAAILVCVVFAAAGRGGEMARFPGDYAPPDSGAMAAVDVALLRPPTALWGYHMQVTDEALSQIAAAISARDVRIASLERQIADLRASRPAAADAPWPPRAAATQTWPLRDTSHGGQAWSPTGPGATEAIVPETGQATGPGTAPGPSQAAAPQPSAGARATEEESGSRAGQEPVAQPHQETVAQPHAELPRPARRVPGARPPGSPAGPDPAAARPQSEEEESW
jgi:hypothetical protein